MITIKPKTRQATQFKTIEDLIPHICRISKNWRVLTPLINTRLLAFLESNTTFSGLHLMHKHIAKNILEMRSGTFQKDHYLNIFGWVESDIDKMLSEKGKLFKESTGGGLTPGMKEFWMMHHNMSEEDAIKSVSNAQRKLSSRKKKTTINQPTSLAYYTHRGASEDEAVKLQSETQKKRRNNCVEYWINKGHSEEDAVKEISKIQRLRSKLSIDYWLSRGYSLDEAQEESIAAQKLQLPGKVSKVSKKFFLMNCY